MDITLKDLQKELKAGQTEAKLDVNKYLKKYDDNIWKYFEEEIKKTKYAAMLDELKEYKTELYELTEYRGKNIKGATEYIMESIHDKYVESQGFDVEDDHKSSVSPTQITPIIISWKNKISAEEWQKYWDLFQHMYYHNYIAVHIEEDLDQNQKPGAWTKDEDTQDDVGYNRSGTKNLFEKYGNLPWEEAYKKAIEFHRNAVEEDSKKIEEWRTEHMLNFNPWDLMHITNNHTKIDKWVDNFLQVGEEPSEPPIKLDPPTPDMLKKATKEED